VAKILMKFEWGKPIEGMKCRWSMLN